MSLATKSNKSSKMSYTEWKEYNSSFESAKKSIQNDSSSENNKKNKKTSHPKFMVMATTAGVGGIRMYDHLLYSKANVDITAKKNKAVVDKQQRYSYQSFGDGILPWRNGSDESQYFRVNTVCENN